MAITMLLAVPRSTFNNNEVDTTTGSAYYLDDKNKWRSANREQIYEEVLRIKSSIESHLRARSVLFQPGHVNSTSPGVGMGKTVIPSQKLPLVPGPLESEHKFKIRKNNAKEWFESKRTGRIVVSDYDVGQITLISQPSYNDVGRGYCGYTYITFQTIFGVPNNDFYYSSPRFRWGGRAIIRLHYDYVDRTYEPAQIPILASDLQHYFEVLIDPEIVTATVAEADRGIVDALTSVAEMPDTIKSVLGGFRAVANAIRAFKNKEITVSDAFTKRKASNKARFLEQRKRLENRYAGKKLTQQMQKQLDRERAALAKTFDKAMKNTAMELADALADVWMNFRYNIMPNVYLVEDLIELSERLTITYKTTRDVAKRELLIQLENYTDLKIDVKTRCVIKRRLDPSVQIPQLISANVFQTGFELLTRSFIAGWFINIGDLITAYTTPNLSLDEGAVYSELFECDQTLDSTDGSSRQCHVKLKVYRRRVIDPMLNTGLATFVNMSLFRKFDAIALLWGPIKRLLQHSSRN